MKRITMKANTIIISALVVSAAFLTQPAKAQTSTPGYSPDGVVLNKTVIEGSEPNTYTINLETFVTGESSTNGKSGNLDVVLVLDYSSSMDGYGNKAVNLQIAVRDFIDQLAEYAGDKEDKVNLAVFPFAQWAYDLFNIRKYTKGEYKGEPMGIYYGWETNKDEVTLVFEEGESDYGSFDSFKPLTKTNKETIKNLILEPNSKSFLYNVSDADGDNGTSSIDYGVMLGVETVQAIPASRQSSKILVVFTDGAPNYPYQAQGAIDMAYRLKHSGIAEVYTVGLSASSIIKDRYNNPVMTAGQFLSYLSSNYPNAQMDDGYDMRGTNQASDTYFMAAENASQLSGIFKSIADVVTGGADYNLEEAATTVIDVVSPAFKLPDGADGSKIDLFAAKCLRIDGAGTDGSANYIWDTPFKIRNELFPNVAAEVGVLNKTTVGDVTTVTFTPQAGGKTVSVTGFDFSGNFVGYRKSPAGDEMGGYKLIISFPIEIDPSNPGGATQNTNTEDSGVYVDNGDGYHQIGGFEIPSVKIPNIVIKKNGLKQGESAIFKVYKVEESGTESVFPIMLVATCTEDGKPAYAKTKIQKVGRYRVEETPWSWAYNITECKSDYGVYEDSDDITDEQWHEKGFGVNGESGYVAQKPFKMGTETTANSITRNVNDFTEEENTTEGYKGTLFEFTNTPKTGTPAHAEANNNNIFYKTN